MSDHPPRFIQSHGDGKDHQGYEVEYEHEENTESDFPTEEDDERKQHPRHVRVALAKAGNTYKNLMAPKRTIEETMRNEIANTIDSTRIIIISFFSNFVYDIIVNGVGQSDIVFALFLVVAFIVWLWIAAYIRNEFISSLKNTVLMDFMSFIDNSFIMLVVRYSLGVIDSMYISSTTSTWAGILVVFTALALVYIVVYAFGRKRSND